MKNIVVIGSGIGGLTAANLLVRRGHHVTVFESHSGPGGYVAGFRKKGYYFESGTLSFESSEPVFRVMKKIGVFDRVKFVRQHSRFWSSFFDGTPKDFEEYCNLFGDVPLPDSKRCDAYFDEVGRMVSAVKGLNRPKGIGMLSYPVRLLRFLSMYKKYENTTVTEFTGRYFQKDTPLYLFFKDQGYPDMAAWILGAAIVTILDDYWTVKGGMQSWTDALVGRLNELGGEIRLNSPVEKILTRNGRAVGILSKGTEFQADAVVSAMDYKKTFLRLLDDPSLVADGLRRKIETTAVSEGIVTVYLGLGISRKELLEKMKIPHVFVFDTRPGTDMRDAGDKSFFEKTSVSLYSPSLHDPLLAPDNRSSLMIQAVAPYRWMDNWGGGDPARYRELKARMQEALIRKASLLIPDLAKRVEWQDSATPLTYERYTGNTDGATSAWSWNPKKRFYKRLTDVNIDTPIKNLFIGSCWSCQIGGVPSAVGAAAKIAKKIG